MLKHCPVCGYSFADGEAIVAVMLSTYKAIESDVSFAVTEPTECVEIIHHNCYDWPDSDDGRETA